MILLQNYPVRLLGLSQAHAMEHTCMTSLSPPPCAPVSSSLGCAFIRNSAEFLRFLPFGIWKERNRGICSAESRKGATREFLDRTKSYQVKRDESQGPGGAAAEGHAAGSVPAWARAAARRRRRTTTMLRIPGSGRLTSHCDPSEVRRRVCGSKGSSLRI